MIALVAFATGAVLSALLWLVLGPTLTAAPALQRENLHGRRLPVGSGIVLALAVLLAGATYEVVRRAGGVSVDEAARGDTVVTLVVATLGFAFVGVVDDLAGTVVTKGVRGHVVAAVRGEVTTGLVKLVSGGVLSLLVAALLTTAAGSDGAGLLAVARAGVVVAAASNVGNLFDRAPGRAIKVSLLVAVLIAVAGAPGWALTGPMLVLGAGAGLLVADLRERCMLGDAGANPLGAAMGAGLVVALGPAGEWVALAVLVGLNLAAERISFTRVIDRARPLRALDRWGTTPERRRAP